MPRLSSARAIATLAARSSTTPACCSPSRRVQSDIRIRRPGAIAAPDVWLNGLGHIPFLGPLAMASSHYSDLDLFKNHTIFMLSHAADWIAAIPIRGSLTNHIEEAPSAWRQFRHFYCRPRSAFIPEINKRAASVGALLAHRVAVFQCAFIELIIIFRPARPVLHSFVPGSQELLIHAGRIAALMNQLKLDVSGIGERH